MSAPSPGPFREHIDAAVAAVEFQVNRDTVLRARAVMLAEADRLDDHLAGVFDGTTGFGLCGTDPVSFDARSAFTERIAALLQQCESYTRDLREAARALDEVARGYGLTEDEIAASFQGAG